MTALQQARLDRHWSQARAIAELQRHARAVGVALPSHSSLKTELSRWENGHRKPDTLYCRLFQLAYGRTAEQLGLGQVQDDTALGVSADWQECVVNAARLWSEDMNRRDFLKSAAFVAGGYAGPSLHALVSSDLPRPQREIGERTIGAAEISVIQNMTRNLSLVDNQHGGGQVRRTALAFLEGEVSPLLSTGAFPETTGRDLFKCTAELARLVGWMTHDVGRHGLAQRYLIHALGLAEAANDSALMSEMLAAMSQQATYMGEALEAVDLARGARSLAARAGVSALVAEASVMEAHGHARAGNSKACAAALTAAEVALDQADRSADPHWIGYFDEAYLSAKFGHCFRELGDHANAIRFAERSLKMDTRYVRGRVFNLTLLAHSHSQAGNLDQACAVGRDAGNAGAELRSHRAVKHLRDFRQTLTPLNGSMQLVALDDALAPVLRAA
ncbi:MAG TPA: helix-turn-helix transcriptional regulator [Propionibacteriaceae bacterium]|nr:helix-turn-helix transcriptional regulator [Propionibacteriaceae bacterium]